MGNRPLQILVLDRFEYFDDGVFEDMLRAQGVIAKVTNEPPGYKYHTSDEALDLAADARRYDIIIVGANQDLGLEKVAAIEDTQRWRVIVVSYGELISEEVARYRQLGVYLFEDRNEFRDRAKEIFEEVLGKF